MKRIFLLLVVVLSNDAFGQDQGQSELGSWYMYFGKNKLSEKWSIHSEVQGRFYKPVSSFNQLLVRVGMNYNITKDAMVTAGYAYIPTESYEKGTALQSSLEHRIWQQFILNDKVGRFYFEHRYRVEQRWVEKDNGESYYKNRLRYRIMVSMPINSPELKENTWYLGVYNELFMHTEADPYDQNRLYFALGYKVNSLWNFQAGYLRHNIKNLDYNRLQFALFLNPDFSKKQ